MGSKTNGKSKKKSKNNMQMEEKEVVEIEIEEGEEDPDPTSMEIVTDSFHSLKTFVANLKTEILENKKIPNSKKENESELHEIFSSIVETCTEDMEKEIE